MIIYYGKAVNNKTAMGMARVIHSGASLFDVTCRPIDETDIGSELDRLEDSVIRCRQELSEQSSIMEQRVDIGASAIFEMHSLLLADQGLMNAIKSGISERKENAEYAVQQAIKQYVDRFRSSGDEVLASRADDMIDVGSRLIESLIASCSDSVSDSDKDESGAQELPYIVVAEKLLPSDIMRLSKDKILAIVTKEGTPNSHVGVLASMMGIPAVVGVQELDVSGIDENMMMIVDGDNPDEGSVYITPTVDAIQMASVKIKKQKECVEDLSNMIGLRTETKTGQTITLNANISSLEELKLAIQSDAEGIGLVRTEYLFMDCGETCPDEAAQEKKYRAIMDHAQGLEVVFRTLDAGADKPVGFIHIKQEENPALGMRGVRIGLTKAGRELFKTQLRALCRVAADYDNLKIMYPLITSTLEVTRIEEIIEEIREELSNEHIAFRIPKQGIMIETPAAVLMAEELARMTDFFSIGTNDLTQYTLAADRTNENVAQYYMSHHPAVLREILMTTRAAHKAGIPVTICGEMAGEQTFITDWLAMGIDELSVSPDKILKLRKLIRDKE